MKRYLGIDWGEERIGLAISEPGLKLALPFQIVKNLNELIKIIKEEHVDILVLGQPNKLSGAQANNPAWLKFLAGLKSKTEIPIILADERLSSRALESLLATEPSFRSRQIAQDDKVASLILQTYLDSLDL